MIQILHSVQNDVRVFVVGLNIGKKERRIPSGFPLAEILVGQVVNLSYRLPKAKQSRNHGLRGVGGKWSRRTRTSLLKT